VFFNLNGHAYRGFDHWARLWAHYRTQFKTTNPWLPFDTRIVIGADMAVVTCQRTSRLEWIGDEPQASFAARELTSRSTEVYAKRDGDWRVIHVHFSPASDEPRPGGV
jgi:ketosteroid isomerase-like protein